MFKQLAVLLVLLVCFSAVLSENTSETMISIKPSKPGVASVSMGDFHCRFEYDVTGGTKEEWEMFVDELEDGTYSCTVGRPRSYLFFRQWKLTVTAGYKILFKSMEIENNGASLGSEVMKFDPTGVTLNEVSSQDGWTGNMSGIYLEARAPQKPQQEL